MTSQFAEHDTEEAAPRHGGGRHLDSSRDDALRAAALRLLGEIGYDRLTVDAIAACAGAGKATIYRRWSGKAELVVDALTCKKRTFDVPDTGTLRGDLEELSRRATGGGQQLDTSLMIGLVSALPHDPELRDVFRERLVAPHVRWLVTIFERAVERGEIAPVANLDLVASLLPALILHRLLVVGIPPDQRFIESVVTEVILPLVLAGDPQGATRLARPH